MTTFATLQVVRDDRSLSIGRDEFLPANRRLQSNDTLKALTGFSLVEHVRHAFEPAPLYPCTICLSADTVRFDVL